MNFTANSAEQQGASERCRNQDGERMARILQYSGRFLECLALQPNVLLAKQDIRLATSLTASEINLSETIINEYWST